MPNDEQAIREVVAAWMRATAAGDLQQVLHLMADDVVFLTPGRQPFERKEFEAGFKTMQSQSHIQGDSDIQEIQVRGDLAYCWNKLDVTITPLNGGPPQRRSGHVLSIMRKQPDGSWVLARDANLLGEAE